MNFKIFRVGNYIYIVDDRDVLWEEHYSLVKVNKFKTSDSVYKIEFLRPESTREAFLEIPFGNILTQAGVPYASQAVWETWYTENTGPSSGQGLATEATLQQIETNTTGVARTPGIIRPSNTSGDVNTVAATFYSVSVANAGSADGTVLGSVIKPGEILNFSADAVNNFFTSFPYDATGTEFIIIYVA